MLKGTGVSAGVGLGKALVLKEQELDWSGVRFAGETAEKQRLAAAAAAVSAKLDAMAAAMAEQACKEVQEETALGAYLLDYISYTDTQERAYYEMHVRLGYRRTAEEQAGIVTATSTEALPDLLRLTAREGSLSRIAVRFTYFTADRDGIRDMVRSVQEEVDPGFTEPWQVNFYPDTDDVGIVEVVLREA